MPITLCTVLLSVKSRLSDHAGSEGQVHADSALIQHFHRQDNPSLQAGPPPRGQEAASNSPSAPQLQQGPDLLLGWQSAGGHMGVHHLYNCHLKVRTASSRQLLLCTAQLCALYTSQGPASVNYFLDLVCQLFPGIS